MAIATAVTDSYKQEILQGIHLAADTYNIALYTSAATLGQGTTVYSATNEVVGAGYAAGGKALAGFAVSLDTHTGILTFTTPTWAASSITARGCLIYNTSRSNKAVASYDFGADITSTNGTFTATIPAATAAAGLIRIA
jgi:hypothetical protein